MKITRLFIPRFVVVALALQAGIHAKETMDSPMSSPLWLNYHASEPAIDLRMLKHWDNMSGDIERGYGGNSLGAERMVVRNARTSEG